MRDAQTLKAVPQGWHLKLVPPRCVPRGCWQWEPHDYVSLVLASATVQFHIGVWQRGNHGHDDQVWELIPIDSPTGNLAREMTIPDPCLPDEWLRMPIGDQLVILMQTLQDIIEGIWDCEIGPFLNPKLQK